MLKWLLLIVVSAAMMAEFWALLALGERLGVMWSLIWIGVTFLAGLVMARWAGLKTLIRIHHKLREEILPTNELMDMGMILVGALCLVLPGFISDALGILLLLPPVRWMVRCMVRLAYGGMLPASRTRARRGTGNDDVIEIRPEDVN